MTFDAREARSKANEIYKPFGFTGYDGEDYELPHAKMLDPARSAELQSDDPEERAGAMAKLAPEAWAAIEAMEPGVQVMLVEAWYEHSGLGDDEDVDGEGKGLPRSSPASRTAKRSKRTSRSGASTSTRSRSGK